MSRFEQIPGARFGNSYSSPGAGTITTGSGSSNKTDNSNANSARRATKPLAGVGKYRHTAGDASLPSDKWKRLNFDFSLEGTSSDAFSLTQTFSAGRASAPFTAPTPTPKAFLSATLPERSLRMLQRSPAPKPRLRRSREKAAVTLDGLDVDEEMDRLRLERAEATAGRAIVMQAYRELGAMTAARAVSPASSPVGTLAPVKPGSRAPKRKKSSTSSAPDEALFSDFSGGFVRDSELLRALQAAEHRIAVLERERKASAVFTTASASDTYTPMRYTIIKD